MAKAGNWKSDRIHKFRNRHDHIGKLILLDQPAVFSSNKEWDDGSTYLIRLLLGLNKIIYTRHLQHLTYSIAKW